MFFRRARRAGCRKKTAVNFNKLQEEAMGKKKSAALIALVTVVLVGLLFLCITPTFPVKSPNSFRSLLSIVELGRDLDGGYYTVYYPEGVISKAEYETLKASYDYDSESTENPDDNYVAYKGIYLSKDIAEEGGVTQEFQDQFDAALRAVNKRYEKAGMSDYTLRVQYDYTIRIEIPGLDFDDYYAEQYAQSMITYFSYSGGIVLSDASAADGEATAQMEGSGENIRSVTTANAGDSGYAVVINLTSAGREAFREMTSTISSSSSSSSSATVYEGRNGSGYAVYRRFYRGRSHGQGGAPRFLHFGFGHHRPFVRNAGVLFDGSRRGHEFRADRRDLHRRARVGDARILPR